MTRKERLIAECRERAAKRKRRIRVLAGRKCWRKLGKRGQWEMYRRLARMSINSQATFAARRAAECTAC